MGKVRAEERGFVHSTFGGIAQLIRAPALQAGGPGFESLCLHHMG